MDELSFLKQYRKSIEFVSNESLLEMDKTCMPAQWLEIFREADKTRRTH